MSEKYIKNKDTYYLENKLEGKVLLRTFDPLSTSVTQHNGLNLELRIISSIKQSLMSEVLSESTVKESHYLTVEIQNNSV